MKLYRIQAVHDEYGTMYAWAGTQANAKKAAKEMDDMHHFKLDADPTIEVVEVPTDKKGLLRWLNVYVSRCNG
jgi:hypothetical protein